MGSTEKPLPTLQNIHRDDVDKIIQAIIDDGACIIKNFASIEAVERVNADTRPYLEADKPWKVNKLPYNSMNSTKQTDREISFHLRLEDARAWLLAVRQPENG